MYFYTLISLATLLVAVASAAPAEKTATVTKTITTHKSFSNHHKKTRTVTRLSTITSSTATIITETATSTTTVTTATTPPQWTAQDIGYHAYICATDTFNNCLSDNTLTTDPSSPTQFGLDSGAIIIIYNNNLGYVPDSINGGNLTFSQPPGGYALQCFYNGEDSGPFNCFNGQGQEFLWYQFSDSSVGVGLNIPQAATQFQAYWV